MAERTLLRKSQLKVKEQRRTRLRENVKRNKQFLRPETVNTRGLASRREGDQHRRLLTYIVIIKYYQILPLWLPIYTLLYF